MKNINKAIYLLVGGLFVFSGAVKLNDPVGTAIKLEEYFEVFAADFTGLFHLLVPAALVFSVVLNTAEVVLGTALVIGFRRKWVVAVLLGLIVFFTFLTFYSAYFNKVTDCGCFGDAIPLTPWQSFGKDIILLLLLVFLGVQGNRLGDERKSYQGLAVVFSGFLSVAVAWYAIRHLPFIDFRAYKVGNNIAELMQPQQPCQYIYVMEKDGETVEMTTYPNEGGYTFVEMRIVNEAFCMPKITDFNLNSPQGEDRTEEVLSDNWLLVVVHQVDGTERAAYNELKQLLAEADKLGIKSLAVSSDAANLEGFLTDVQMDVPHVYADATVLKTMIRSNPGVILMQEGTIRGKWHFNDTPEIAAVEERLE